MLQYLSPKSEGTLTPSQLHVLDALTTRAKDLLQPEYDQLLQWSRTPANVTGRTFVR